MKKSELEEGASSCKCMDDLPTIATEGNTTASRMDCAMPTAGKMTYGVTLVYAKSV